MGLILKKEFTLNKYIVLYQVEEKEHQIRLDQFISQYLKTFSREQIKKKIKQGEIELLDRPGLAKPSTRLNYKEKLRLTISRSIHEDEFWRGKKIITDENPMIIYQDDQILCIEKPAYMSVHPTGRHLFNCATVILESKLSTKLKSIHRLDRETSGLLLLAKNSEAATKLGLQFEENKIKKCYFLIGVKNQNENRLQDFSALERLGVQSSNDMCIPFYTVDSKEGKTAQTDFEFLEEISFQDKHYVLALAYPKTGRQHQIRVHAKAHNFPLLGDKLYLGSYKIFQNFKDQVASKSEHDLIEIPRHALHAIGLKFFHQDKEKIITGTLPSDLRSWLEENLSINCDLLEEKILKKINTYFEKIERK